jgi:hypothetical protein
MPDSTKIAGEEQPSKIRSADIRIKGRNYTVPSARVGDRLIVVSKRLPRIASIRDEEFIQGEPVSEPGELIDAMRKSGFRADLFTFVQKFPDVVPKYNYRMEWDNVAAVEVKSYSDWFQNRISYSIRKNIKRSEKRGITVEQREFNDQFVREVLNIYNEIPVRQGRKFWHYGKNFETIKKEIATYIERSIFLGAFFEGRMVGFIKMVFVDNIARFMHIVSMASHNDKHPTNHLIAKAVEICEREGCTHLTYGKYIYGKNAGSSLTEFKHRNGFEQFLIPRYYIPLSMTGQMLIKLKMHRGIKALIPAGFISTMLGIRSQYHKIFNGRSQSQPNSNSDPGGEKAEE